MPKICYVSKNFSPASEGIISQAETIIDEYSAQGYDLTLRQLYYQFVARNIIEENSQKEYKKLGSIINDARMAGLIDWDAIVDRTRNLQANSHWDRPQDIVDTCVTQFQIEKWKDQPKRVEVWIEKDALVGVIADICSRLDVPYFSCRGYTSQSEMWRAGQRILGYGVPTYILHLGDHDPSGIDMSRDIVQRLRRFAAGGDNPADGTITDGVGTVPTVERLALNMNQVRRYNPPPNPAKVTDVRARKYIAQYGEESWELDALEPRVLEKLIAKAVLKHRDEKLWAKAVAREKRYVRALAKVAKSLAPKKGKR